MKHWGLQYSNPVKMKGMVDMNDTGKSPLKQTKREISEYSLVFMIISVSSLMAFITLPNEMVTLFKGAVDFLLK
ncbi:hypothetical protein ACFOU2_09295 [Bacillus songklensis]|uniref:Uncharacterized protein n=1 Tax=Bacillus songklensis TaxID=1069116 RepID=A0ABV8B078_9BACI